AELAVQEELRRMRAAGFLFERLDEGKAQGLLRAARAVADGDAEITCVGMEGRRCKQYGKGGTLECRHGLFHGYLPKAAESPPRPRGKLSGATRECYIQNGSRTDPVWEATLTSTYRIAPEIFFIDRRDRRTLQMQLATSIVSTILDTRALPGTRMPSTRKLSETLNISRLTVTLVYQDLVAQGYLEPLPRSGFVISRKVPHRRVQADTAASGVIPAVDWTARLAHRLDQRRKISKPRDWRRYPYPFIYGQVDPTLFDHNAWRDCARRALGQRDFPELADDRLAQDDPVLVDYVRRNTLPRRGISASPDEVLITLGAQNALWIAATLL